MKKILLVLSIILLFPIQSLLAQNDTDYNRKGDQALLNQDYLEARMWYSEGVDKCDKYSIHQLIELWKSQPSMRISMRTIMSKCFNCLEGQSLAGDTDAMILLSECYKKGIGSNEDSIKSDYWNRKAFGLPTQISIIDPSVLDSIKELNINSFTKEDTTSKPTKTPSVKKIDYFASYTFSPTMPIGIMLGGISRTSPLGFYINAKANLKSQSTSYEIDNEGDMINYTIEGTYYNYSDNYKRGNLMFTAGPLIRIYDKIYGSIGAGYGKRDLFLQANEFNDSTGELINKYWCKSTDGSYSGLAIEIGGIYKYNHFIFSAGCNTIKFKDLDMYVGIGYSF